VFDIFYTSYNNTEIYLLFLTPLALRYSLHLSPMTAKVKIMEGLLGEV